MSTTYSEQSIETLDWKEHIRRRPGMYIGKLGDGSSFDDGIYVLLKEVTDNSIDEYMMGFGKKIQISVSGNKVTVRDYGRGIPLGKVVDVVSQMNTGGKYNSNGYKKSVGLNGVGLKAVNALSSELIIRSVRDGEMKQVTFNKGQVVSEEEIVSTEKDNGTFIQFTPDKDIFKDYNFIDEYVEELIKNYVYLNTGLTIIYNQNPYFAKRGLADLLNDDTSINPLYPIIHLKGDDIEIAITHSTQQRDNLKSFVNGQFTTQGGTHLSAFREALVKTFRDFYKKDYDPNDIKSYLTAAVSVKVEDPIFESQTKTKLGSKDMGPDGPSIRNFMSNFLTKELDNFLYKNSEIADVILRRLQESEKERKAISNIKKLARQKSKKINLHNKKLRDCRAHFNSKHKDKDRSSIFITEGDSASGSITKSRDVNTQAVFSLRGKPLNSYGQSKQVVYKNDEFNLLQAALNIEEGIDELRYNQVIIATDADVDGMHIRLLIITFFLQFFPDLIKNGHLYILQTPLFRVRSKKETFYCYSDQEKEEAITKLKVKSPEITRFKGLGEISPDEFKNFIGDDIRLEPVVQKKDLSTEELLRFYMGSNTPDRQQFIIDNLYVEKNDDNL